MPAHDESVSHRSGLATLPPSKSGAYSGKTKGKMETLGFQDWTKEERMDLSTERRVKDKRRPGGLQRRSNRQA